MATAVFLGLATLDIIYGVEGLPRENVKGVARRQEVVSGGPATNAAIACAHLGTETQLVAAVGRHPMSRVIAGELAGLGVELVDLAAESDESPSISTIFVNLKNATRTIVSGHLTRSQVEAWAFDAAWLDGASVLMVDGHQMACAIRAAAAAKERGIPVVLDGGSWKPRMDELLQHVRYAICSENFHPPETRDTFEYLREGGVESAAITRGEGSILWAEGGARGEIAVPKANAVDTTAAGDVFHGAFCHFIASGKTFQAALREAAEVASFSCQFFGTREWMKAERSRHV